MYRYLLIAGANVIAGANDGAQLFGFLPGFVVRITLSTFPAFLR
jgi:hypothetical protein